MLRLLDTDITSYLIKAKSYYPGKTGSTRCKLGLYIRHDTGGTALRAKAFANRPSFALYPSAPDHLPPLGR